MTREQLIPGPAAAEIGGGVPGRVEEVATELTTRIRRAEPFYDKNNVLSADDLRASGRGDLIYILSRLADRPTSGGLERDDLAPEAARDPLPAGGLAR